MSQDIIVGIDLGTTYSAVAVYRNGQVEIVPNDQGSHTTPSWVSFTETDRLVGQPAKDKAVINPINTVFGVKRFLGKDYDDPTLQENLLNYPYDIIANENQPLVQVEYKNELKQFAPEEISSIVLEKLKECAEKYLGCPVSKAVITVPAHFNDSQRQATKNAGRIAGLEVMRIINEPTAASLAYGLHTKYQILDKSCTILIYDFGGGTFDVSIVTIENGVFEVKTTNGEAFLGGDDIDLNLTNHFAEEFRKKYNIDLFKNKKAIRRLRNQCEKLKKDLTFNRIATIEIDYIYVDGDKSYDLISSLDRETFNNLNAELFDKTLRCVQKAFMDAEMIKEDIDEIILIGGSSRIPKVRSLITEFFKKELNASLNPDEAVARGAAIQAAILSGATDDISLLLYDVCPLSLGIEMRGGLMSVIIPRNTQIPTSRRKRYETSEHGVSQIPVIVYEGESEMVKRNRKLGEFLIKIPRRDRGQLKFDVFFDVNVEGILNVTAKLIDGDLAQDLQIDINRSGLSEDEIDRMIDDARKHRVEDEYQKNVGIAKYELQECLTDFKDQLVIYELDDDDLTTYSKIADEIEEWLHRHDILITTEDCREKKKKIEKELLPILMKHKLVT